MVPSPTKPAGGPLRWGSVEITSSKSVELAEAVRSTDELATEPDAYDEYVEDFENYGEDFEDFESEEQSDEPVQNQRNDVKSAPLHAGGNNPQTSTKPNFQVPSFHTPAKLPPALDQITEVQKALRAENEKASSLEFRRREDLQQETAKRLERVSSALPKRRFVGLETARKEAQRAKLSVTDSRQALRAKDLSKLITLDVCDYDLFNLNPMNEYELYIRNYGTSNTVQASTQCNEDRAEEDSQTDTWDTGSRWVQAPQESFTDAGTGNPLTQSARAAIKAAAFFDEMPTVDAARLSSFLRRAGQVIDTLLEENGASMGNIPRTFDSSSSLTISQGFTKFKPQTFLKGRTLRDACYSNSDHRMILIAYSPVLEGPTTSSLDESGILCVWRLTDPAEPYRILVCESPPTCCCFATTRPSLVFAGTESGSISAWDLQEFSPSHKKIAAPESTSETMFRYPSYSTAGIYTLDGSHEEPIRNLIALPHAQEPKESASSFSFALSGASTGSFQVASVDEAGALQLWTVIELLDESFAAAEVDFGMGIGSRIKLVRSTALKLTSRNRDRSNTGISVRDCKFFPSDIDRFVVATDSGDLLSESRFRDRCHPRTYCLKDASSIPCPDAATTLDFCPHDPRLFLTGFASGTVGLFSSRDASAVMTWEASRLPIVMVRWSPQRPAVFYVLDEAGCIRVWDLDESASEPAHVVTPRSTGNAQVALFALSQTMGSAAVTASQANLVAAARRSSNTTLLLGYADGSTEVHLLDSMLAEEGIDEVATLAGYVDGTGGGRHERDLASDTPEEDIV
ncbi:WD repeat-containing protein 60 [Thoreauomyces humboldtii]|nr:WD repeat-containing protein 60 [Thoreauomyces humboldtii]